MHAFADALTQYRLDTGSYPSESEGLNVLVEKPDNVNNWNGPYLAQKKFLMIRGAKSISGITRVDNRKAYTKWIFLPLIIMARPLFTASDNDSANAGTHSAGGA